MRFIHAHLISTQRRDAGSETDEDDEQEADEPQEFFQIDVDPDAPPKSGASSARPSVSRPSAAADGADADGDDYSIDLNESTDHGKLNFDSDEEEEVPEHDLISLGLDENIPSLSLIAAQSSNPSALTDVAVHVGTPRGSQIQLNITVSTSGDAVHSAENVVQDPKALSSTSAGDLIKFAEEPRAESPHHPNLLLDVITPQAIEEPVDMTAAPNAPELIDFTEKLVDITTKPPSPTHLIDFSIELPTKPDPVPPTPFPKSLIDLRSPAEPSQTNQPFISPSQMQVLLEEAPATDVPDPDSGGKKKQLKQVTVDMETAIYDPLFIPKLSSEATLNPTVQRIKSEDTPPHSAKARSSNSPIYDLPSLKTAFLEAEIDASDQISTTPKHPRLSVQQAFDPLSAHVKFNDVAPQMPVVDEASSPRPSVDVSDFDPLSASSEALRLNQSLTSATDLPTVPEESTEKRKESISEAFDPLYTREPSVDTVPEPSQIQSTPTKPEDVAREFDPLAVEATTAVDQNTEPEASVSNIAHSASVSQFDPLAHDSPQAEAPPTTLDAEITHSASVSQFDPLAQKESEKMDDTEEPQVQKGDDDAVPHTSSSVSQFDPIPVEHKTAPTTPLLTASSPKSPEIVVQSAETAQLVSATPSAPLPAVREPVSAIDRLMATPALSFQKSTSDSPTASRPPFPNARLTSEPTQIVASLVDIPISSKTLEVPGMNISASVPTPKALASIASAMAKEVNADEDAPKHTIKLSLGKQRSAFEIGHAPAADKRLIHFNMHSADDAEARIASPTRDTRKKSASEQVPDIHQPVNMAAVSYDGSSMFYTLKPMSFVNDEEKGVLFPFIGRVGWYSALLCSGGAHAATVLAPGSINNGLQSDQTWETAAVCGVYF